MTDGRQGEPLRIAFLNSWKTSSYEGSGTAIGIFTLGKGLRALGHQLHVLSSPPGPGPLLDRRIRFNLNVGDRIRKTGPHELVVGFDMDGAFLPRSGMPTFVLCLKGIAADEARFETGPDRLMLEAVARFEALNTRRSENVVVPSRYSAERAATLYGLPASRFRIVPEPLDPKPWKRLRDASPAKAPHPTILSVARQYPRKDTITLLDAVPMVRNQVPDVYIRIIGGGPELERLRAHTRRLGIAERVTFHGAVPDDGEVRRAYMEAHVFCLPSRQEGFGIVFLEAAAAGLPVVAARAGAVPEVVLHGRTGLLVPPQDPAALARALIRILRSPSLAHRLGSAGMERAADFAPTTIARRFLEATGVLEGSPQIPASPETPARA